MWWAETDWFEQVIDYYKDDDKVTIYEKGCVCVWESKNNKNEDEWIIFLLYMISPSFQIYDLQPPHLCWGESKQGRAHGLWTTWYTLCGKWRFWGEFMLKEQ